VAVVIRRRHKWLAIIGAIVVGLGVWGIFAWRTLINQQQHYNLCSVIAGLVVQGNRSAGTPGTPGYFYYQHHPEELAALHAQNRQTLRQLNCKPYLPPPAPHVG
jgi:hypothetical protein